MSEQRSVADKLRAEYFDLLPEMRRVAEQLETVVRHHLLAVTLRLSTYEFVEVATRLKACDSAVDSLRRREQAGLFDEAKFETYSLLSLKDLVGIKVMAFPPGRVKDVASAILPNFLGWTSDPLPPAGSGEPNLGTKLHGYCTASHRVRAEIQIVSMLAGQFLNVEHAAIYKPAPNLRGAVKAPELMEKRRQVFVALREFEEAFEHVIRESTEK